MEIRYMASEDDRAAISKIYEEAWRYAYKNIVPQPYLDSIPAGFWASKLDNPNRQTLILVDNKKFIGTSSFGKSRSPQFENWGEVISVYLLPEYIGKGYGRILLQSAVFELKKQGYENIFLWVLEDNRSARRFYERLGFSPKETMVSNIGGKDLTEIRYVYNTAKV